MYEFAPELKSRLVFFMKFSNDLWTLESLREGNLYMNTIGYYREKKAAPMLYISNKLLTINNIGAILFLGGILW